MVKTERVEFDGRISPLSPLEEKIMSFLWEKGPSHVSLISENINASLSSVAATLDRLVKNGLVERKQERVDGRRKFVYYPKMTREEVTRRFVENVLDRLVENFGELVIEYFHKKGAKK
ncbi:MAG: BlaI/MecI/CopY family transcriptional regulator [Archaeoglobi archaeon]|nr:BlaI/MecI/CopY family transcriptional regulator [Archaeoglobi archaeon]